MTSVIKVDTIQNSTGTSALSIGADGVVTANQDLSVSGNLLTPARPMFNIRGGGGAQSATAVIGYSGTGGYYFNVGNHFNTSTKAFTAPVNGYYFFQLSFYSNNGNSGTVKLDVDGGSGSGVANTYNWNSATAYETHTYCTFLYLTTGQVVTPYVTNGSVYTDADTNFAGFLIG